VIPHSDLLGVRVHTVGLDSAADVLEAQIEAQAPIYVCLANVHVVESARRMHSLACALSGAGMVLPDGAPIAWFLSRKLGRPVQRVTGSDLFDELCSRSVDRGYRHFFVGSTPATLKALDCAVHAQHPGISVVGVHSPPFRQLTDDEIDALVEKINTARPDLVWVGLGAPRQEIWMAHVRPRLAAPVLIGIGAVFDFASGMKRRAPTWAQRSGLEWAHRLATEPRRLAGRYVKTNTTFLLRIAALTISMRNAHGR
jgi:N-acetylglucosaminyldiphosphoundecaprenol N-acetyl-beta-D-mannosaminyltransferase